MRLPACEPDSRPIIICGGFYLILVQSLDGLREERGKCHPPDSVKPCGWHAVKPRA